MAEALPGRKRREAAGLELLRLPFQLLLPPCRAQRVLRGAAARQDCPHTRCMHAYIHTYTHTYIHTYIHSYIHTFIHSYIHKCIHAYIHTCITLHYITLHCIALHYLTLHYITLHYIALHCITSHYITSHHITLHYITLHCIALHYITLHYITLHYITIHALHNMLGGSFQNPAPCPPSPWPPQARCRPGTCRRSPPWTSGAGPCGRVPRPIRAVRMREVGGRSCASRGMG